MMPEKQKKLLAEEFFDIDPTQPLREPLERKHEIKSLCWLERTIIKKHEELLEEKFFDTDPVEPLHYLKIKRS